jgi:PTH1 family peptidyl-tRNA hydrolase
VGFLVVDSLIRHGRNKWVRGNGSFWVSERFFENNEALVAKPAVFMNDSGRAVKEILAQYGVSPDQTLIVVDDVNLQMGKIRFRFRGSSGGHHGLESIIKILGTGNFPRLRLGIGVGDQSGQDLTDFVVGAFSKAERALMEPEIERARKACLEWIETGSVSVVS